MLPQPRVESATEQLTGSVSVKLRTKTAKVLESATPAKVKKPAHKPSPVSIHRPIQSKPVPQFVPISSAELEDRETKLSSHLIKHNLRVRKIDIDGDCMFRATADSLYNDLGDANHVSLRRDTCNWLEKNKESISGFFVFVKGESIEKHISKMRELHTWGGNVELYALSAILQREFRVHSFSYIKRGHHSILHESVTEPSGPPILLSHHKGNHYNSLVRVNGKQSVTEVGYPRYPKSAVPTQSWKHHGFNCPDDKNGNPIKDL